MPTQNISMTEELAQFVTEQVKSGDFASVSEVYREALRGLRDQTAARKQYKEFVDERLQFSKQAHENGDYFSLEETSVDAFMATIADEVESEYA